ncbi:hypothetical protein FJZ40_04040 [Candidatus Shapirobacteria bacterium]|nr:hypothetical protein [Candidatus Shapirobacteria bacterium]
MEFRKKKNKVAVSKCWLLVILLLFFGGSFFRLYQLTGESALIDSGRVNFILNAESVFLLSFSPQKNEVLAMKIPDNLQLEALSGYGRYQARSLYELGELEGKSGKLLKESVQEYLGLPLDGWVRASGKATLTCEEGSFKSRLSGILFDLFWGEGKTDFPKGDVARLWFSFRKVPLNNVRVLDLDRIILLGEETLPDKTVVLAADKEKLDFTLQKYFLDEKMREENLAIEVVNLTEHAGLANQAARLVSNIGGRVIGLETQAGKNWCWVKSEKKNRESYTVRKLIKIFNCEFIEAKLADQPAEVILAVGEDYWKKWKEKW